MEAECSHAWCAPDARNDATQRLETDGWIVADAERPLNGTCVNCSVCVSIPDVLDVLARRLTDTCLRIRCGSI